MAKYFYSPLKQKIVLLLAAGVTLCFSGSPKKSGKILKNLPHAWNEIERATLKRIINEFKYKRLVDYVENKDGTVDIVLTSLGEKHALKYDPQNIKVRIPSRWDKKWRMVTYDIPEKKKRARDAVRWELKKIGFLEVQKSVWVYPYDCKDAVDFISEVFETRNFIRYAEINNIAPDADLKLHFCLN
ncbi:hypothetical protein HYS99_01545 [Candidatus Giovannonibacteria bacterium]|nr:hypothetical protein [Candidatus Giovannonibacteria bacterium]